MPGEFCDNINNLLRDSEKWKREKDKANERIAALIEALNFYHQANNINKEDYCDLKNFIINITGKYHDEETNWVRKKHDEFLSNSSLNNHFPTDGANGVHEGKNDSKTIENYTEIAVPEASRSEPNVSNPIKAENTDKNKGVCMEKDDDNNDDHASSSKATTVNRSDAVTLKESISEPHVSATMKTKIKGKQIEGIECGDNDLYGSGHFDKKGMEVISIEKNITKEDSAGEEITVLLDRYASIKRTISNEELLNNSDYMKNVNEMVEIVLDENSNIKVLTRNDEINESIENGGDNDDSQVYRDELKMDKNTFTQKNIFKYLEHSESINTLMLMMDKYEPIEEMASNKEMQTIHNIVDENFDGTAEAVLDESFEGKNVNDNINKSTERRPTRVTKTGYHLMSEKRIRNKITNEPTGNREDKYRVAINDIEQRHDQKEEVRDETNLVTPKQGKSTSYQSSLTMSRENNSNSANPVMSDKPNKPTKKRQENKKLVVSSKSSDTNIEANNDLTPSTRKQKKLRSFQFSAKKKDAAAEEFDFYFYKLAKDAVKLMKAGYDKVETEKILYIQEKNKKRKYHKRRGGREKTIIEVVIFASNFLSKYEHKTHYISKGLNSEMSNSLIESVNNVNDVPAIKEDDEEEVAHPRIMPVKNNIFPIHNYYASRSENELKVPPVSTADDIDRYSCHGDVV